ncbi:CLIP domain-containing serine protease 14D-like [Anopheles funestus]|uniref:CLIP domain-containing serine protease 14D-like n=1 Tax=Anopheles funestus TaxID=62324 RepID=UPI0020C60615|nr:CLIP domain-containing serine protease 14D-like [Anopheles funestus]
MVTLPGQSLERIQPLSRYLWWTDFLLVFLWVCIERFLLYNVTMGRLVWCILVMCSIVCLNTTVAQYLSSCQNPDGEHGTCVLVRECPFARALLAKQKHSNNDIRYLEAIRCGTLETKALVCCNAPNITQTDKPVEAETIAELVENRFSTPEEKKGLLPTECGVDAYRGPNRGDRASLFHFPWNVLIQHRTKDGENRFHCGGSLISDRYVLTAARCIMGIKKTWTITSVRVGEWNLQTDPDCTDGDAECTSPVQDIAIEKITVPSNYTGTGSPAVKQDIALLRLARKVEFNDSVAPICLPFETTSWTNYNAEGGQFYESGWGKTPDATGGSDSKWNYPSVGVSRDVCRTQYPHASIDDGNICAKPLHDQDTCRRDTGGPLMYSHTDRAWYLVGIASFQKQCAIIGEPAVYTNVAPFTDWIVDNLEP